MSSVSWRTPASAVVTVGAILGLVWATGHLISSISFRSAVVVGAGYALLLSTSGTMVSAALQYAGADVSEKEADTGRAVGKVENILILTLTLLGAYTALAGVHCKVNCPLARYLQWEHDVLSHGEYRQRDVLASLRRLS